MLVFNCTQATSQFFSRKLKGKTETFAEPAPGADWRDDQIQHDDGSAAYLEHWQVHLVRFKRRPVLFAMHMPTRFVMAFLDLRPGKPDTFVELFIQRWLNHMLTIGSAMGLLDESDYPFVVQHFMQTHSDLRLFTRSDRSVSIHIAQASELFDRMLYQAGAFPANEMEAAGFDDTANTLLRKIGNKDDYFWPYQAMFRHWWPRSGLAGRVGAEVVEERLEELRRRML